MPWVYIGTSKLKCAYVWTTAVKCIYVWTTKVRPTNAVVDFLLVGWGWSGGWGRNSNNCYGWGWAWWWVIYCTNYTLSPNTYSVTVGTWGSGVLWGVGWNRWIESCFNSLVAGWGGGGNYGNIYWLSWCPQSNSNWNIGCWGSWWWGWAWSAWCDATWTWSRCWWTWWNGLSYSIEWSSKNYAWWWGWGGRCGQWAWSFWGWTGGKLNVAPTAATTCWSGGGWSTQCWSETYRSGAWAWGIFVLRYCCSCWYSISWGTKYLCNWYCIHCFTSNGTLTVS